jgi:transposase
MDARDFRSIGRAAQEELRRRALVLILQQGLSQAQAAEVVGVQRQTVNIWLQRYRAQGEDGVLDGRRVSPRRGKGLLTADEAGKIRGWIADKTPDQLKLPFALWTSRAVRDLIALRCGKTLGLLSLLLDCAPEKVALLVGSQGLDNNIQLCISAIRLLFVPDPKFHRILEVLQSVSKLTPLRNKIIHGITVISSRGDLQAYKKAARKRRTIDLWVENLGLSDVRGVATELENCHQLMIDWIKDADIDDVRLQFAPSYRKTKRE